MHKILLSLSLLFLLATMATKAYGQGWKPAMGGVLETHQPLGTAQFGFEINFEADGPLGRDWMYGHWLDTDSVIRMAGYREGGKWKALPFTASHNSFLFDIVQYGDTMYMGGYFSDVVIEGSNDTIPYAAILKYDGDSIWPTDKNFWSIMDFAVSGDSLLIKVTAYFGDNDTIGAFVLSTNGGASLSFPFSVALPNTPYNTFGPEGPMYIRNGDIYMLNRESEGHFKGVIRWDGQQWHGFGYGIDGMWSVPYDFEFYEDQLYMSGSFSLSEDPRNPGDRIARWNGSTWEGVGGGLDSYGADLFVHDGLLYCQSGGNSFGDVHIPYLAAWDGMQWCGTPVAYSGPVPAQFGVIDDTLYGVWKYFPATADGQPLSYINYFDGDYLNGPDAICSTPGLGEKEKEEVIGGIDLFPNPAADEVRISVEGTSEATAFKLKIFDVKGRLMKSLNLGLSEKSAVVSIEGWAPGIYLVEVLLNGIAVRHDQLVVER